MIRIIRTRTLAALRAEASDARREADGLRDDLAADPRDSAALAEELARATAKIRALESDALAGFARLRDLCADPDTGETFAAQLALQILLNEVDNARKSGVMDLRTRTLGWILTGTDDREPAEEASCSSSALS